MSASRQVENVLIYDTETKSVQDSKNIKLIHEFTGKDHV